ncbi:MAG: hypothetical protein RQ729_01295 [Wenzhouxiangellaceae bacterium]|nr:hypothetical protein [Wenzhouxiangellaceae bacterium]
MRQFQYSSYRIPTSPLARFGLVLGGMAILALSLFVGVIFLAAVAGLGILGAIVMTVRNWLTGGKRQATSNDDPLRVEYRVVRTERDDFK